MNRRAVIICEGVMRLQQKTIFRMTTPIRGLAMTSMFGENGTQIELLLCLIK